MTNALITGPCEGCSGNVDGCCPETPTCRSILITNVIENAAIAAAKVLADERPVRILVNDYEDKIKDICDGFDNALYEVSAHIDRERFMELCGMRTKRAS